MKLQLLIIWELMIILALSGCISSDYNDDLKVKLTGTWILDSVSTARGRYSESGDETKILILKNDTDFSYEWMNGDVGNEYIGKYFVLNNPKREMKTIALIPDFQIDIKDTIREYISFDIVNITSKRLQVVDKTIFIKRDSLPYIRFNKNYIYKKRILSTTDAINIAIPTAIKQYGKERIESQKPYVANKEGSNWVVAGTLHTTKGGVFEIVIDANTAKIVSITHGK